MKPYSVAPTNLAGNTIYDINAHSSPPVQWLTNVGSYVALGSGSTKQPITGQHVIYVDGNVYIPNNITYGSGQYNAATDTFSNVPSLYVIAKGNIYIGPNVTKLDGVYVAQNKCDIPSNSCSSYSSQYGGLINTCANVNSISSISTSAAFAPQQLYSACAQQLTVRGALIAHKVKLERTYASLRNSTAGENPFGATYNCTLGNGNIAPTSTSGCASEVFNFDPQNYLAPSLLENNNNQYDSIISLPPVL